MSGDSQKLLELAERVEKAEGPDRELDEAIACLFAKSHPVFGKPVAMVYAKTYTASLDAALTLVPEGCVADTMGRRRPSSINGRPMAWASIETRDGLVTAGASESGTLPLALCAAALRARAAI